jgi:hypothetical protein
MLTIYCLRQTSHRLILNTSRSIFSTLSHPKSNEVKTKTDATTHNYPGFYNTQKADDVLVHDLKKSTIPTPKIDSTQPVPSNDLLEAKRIGKEPKDDKTSTPTPVITSTEKFSAGLSPLQATSSITPTGGGLFHDAKVSNTPVSPGIPIAANASRITTEEQKIKEEEQIPSSYFSAFRRAISSGLPFFPSRKNISSPVNIATTREYYIPVCN